MKYALLIAYDESLDAAMSPEEGQAQQAEYMKFQEGVGAALLAGERLHPTTDATTVKVRDGEVLTSDGPFAETKEQMAGFYLVDAQGPRRGDRDRSRRSPARRRGSIEVRPIWEM